MDTIDPSQIRSVGGKWYILVVIDDYSHYSWVFFLESKDEVFEHFRSLVLRLNNEYLNCLKAIHSDNGTEFRNASFDEFCLEHEIDQQFSALRVRQQNGVMERKNRTLVEMARMMLVSIGLLGAFGLMLLVTLAIFLIESSCARFYI
jgi:transposase InsO family protein